MFSRYLGGGIGHLEQFPPAHNDDEIIYEYEDNEDEVAGDDIETGDIGENGSDVDSEGDSEDSEEEDVNEDGEVVEHDDMDPGESSDEDMGNSY